MKFKNTEKSMTGQEIHEYLEQTLFAMARAVGVGVDYMEPIVLMGKLRVHKTPEKDDAYYWQQTRLLKVRRKKGADGTEWIFIGPNNETIKTLFQEKRKK